MRRRAGALAKSAGPALACAVALLALAARPALAYLKLGVTVNGAAEAVRWPSLPVRYYISDRPGAPLAADQMQAAAARAFAAWTAVTTADVSYQFAGFTSAGAMEEDGMSTIGFADRASLDRVLATTSFTLDDATGALLEADIVFNPAFAWSTSETGTSGRYDFESIVLHEIGHLSGLGHSALGETQVNADGTRRVIASAAVMFPIAFTAGSTAGRTLQPDDVAGISDLYPADGFRSSTGSISGTVTKNGNGVFGAHVIAFSPATGALVANFTLDESGRFSIAGLTPGAWLVRVEPLDDAEVDSFFDRSAPVDLDFRVTFADRLVIVPRGADSGSVAIQVAPK